MRPCRIDLRAEEQEPRRSHHRGRKADDERASYLSRQQKSCGDRRGDDHRRFARERGEAEQRRCRKEPATVRERDTDERQSVCQWFDRQHDRRSERGDDGEVPDDGRAPVAVSEIGDRPTEQPEPDDAQSQQGKDEWRPASGWRRQRRLQDAHQSVAGHVEVRLGPLEIREHPRDRVRLLAVEPRASVLEGLREVLLDQRRGRPGPAGEEQVERVEHVPGEQHGHGDGGHDRSRDTDAKGGRSARRHPHSMESRRPRAVRRHRG